MCKHPTCGDVCRREKPKKVRKRIPKQRKPIPKMSKKKKEQLKIYSPASQALRNERPYCEIGPILIANGILNVCSGFTEGIHHPHGKVTNELYLNAVIGDKPQGWCSCNACNGWIERNSKKAKELGLKIPDYSSKLSKFKQ